MSKRTNQEIAITEDMGFVTRATPGLLDKAGVSGLDYGQIDYTHVDVMPLAKQKNQFSKMLKQSRIKPQFTHVNGPDGGDYVTLPAGHLAAIVRKMMTLLDQTDVPFGYELAKIAGSVPMNPRPLEDLNDQPANLPPIARIVSNA